MKQKMPQAMTWGIFCLENFIYAVCFFDQNSLDAFPT